MEQHKNVESDEFVNNDMYENFEIPEDVNLDTDSPMETESNDDACDIAMLEKSLLRFLLLLQSKPNITQTVVQLVAEQLKSLFETFSQYSVFVLHEMCASLGVNVHSAEVTVACAKLERARIVMDNIDNAYKRSKWLDENNYLIKPGFDLFRCDRPVARHGGGVMLLFRTKIYLVFS